MRTRRDGMARALRCFEDGRFYEVSDRTLGEAYRLLPSATVNGIVVEALHLARAAAPDVGVISFVVMGNHTHPVLRSGADPTGISRFMQAWKSHVATAVNAHLGRRGTFWSCRFSSIVLLDDDVVLARCVYGVMNPVAAGLCRRFEEWPGISSAEHFLGVRTTCGAIDFGFELPPSWRGLDDAALAEKRAHLLEVVRAKETAVAEERRRTGLPVARVDAVVRGRGRRSG